MRAARHHQIQASGASRPRAHQALWTCLPGAVPLLTIPWRTGATLAIGLVTMVAVACVAAAKGRRVGLCAGIVGAASFDLLAVHPYGSLAVAGRDDLLAVVAMAIIGGIVGHLSEQAGIERAGRAAADAELGELRSMLELAAAGETSGRLIIVAERAVHLATGIPCRYEAVPFLDNLPELHHRSLQIQYGDRGPLATPDLVQVPVRNNGALLGRLVLSLGEDSPVTALSHTWRDRVTAIADQLGQALRNTPC